jgi:low molecular weight protein-tyrosine phosphatase
MKVFKKMKRKKEILFVCLGNICRSPAAEGVMNNIIKKNKMEKLVDVDSAGTIDYHEGEQPDKRMMKAAKKRGYNLKHLARVFDPYSDFDNFDYIITMDDENYQTITELDLKSKYKSKVLKMSEFSSDPTIKEVPDPYYSGTLGFENVLNILEDTCKNLLTKIKIDIESRNKK